MNKKVSVIIPSYNTKGELKRAVDSVLQQTYGDFEIIVVDDNSPDSPARKVTEDIMDQYKTDNRVKYIKHERNMNGAAARNTGIKAATGEYICFLDDDDEYLTDKIEKSVLALSDNPGYDAVYSNVYLCRNDKITTRICVKNEGCCWDQLLIHEGMLGTGSNIFIRRSVLADADRFDERFIRYQDVEFMLRVLEKHKIKALDEFLIKKHMSERNVPVYSKLKANKALVFDTFGYLIERLSAQDRRSYYTNQYRILLKSAICGKKREEIAEARGCLEKYSQLTLLEKIGCSVPCVYIGLKKLHHILSRFHTKTI